MRLARLKPRRILAFTVGVVFLTGCVIAILTAWFFVPRAPQGWGGCPDAGTYAAGLDATGRPIICVPFESPVTP